MAPLADDAVLVRMLFDGYEDGTAFDRTQLIADANLNFTEFGYFGLSRWAASEIRGLERISAERCRYSRHLALYRAVDLRATGLGLVPSGKDPHFDVSAGPVYDVSYGSIRATAPTAEELVDRFLGAAYTGMRNNHFTSRLN